MYRINANEASREELIEIIKQLRQQLRQNQVGSVRIKELEEQVTRLQKELQEKEKEVRVLKHQSELLSEKSAGDEETISVLIKQLEDLTLGEMKTAVGPDDVKVSRAITMPTTSTYPKNKSTVSGKTSQSSPNVTISSGIPVSRTTLGEAVSENVSSSAAIIARQNEEIAKLEMKIRQLIEVNTFYTAIVSHHDEEERLRANEKQSTSGEGANASNPIDVISFQTRISTLEGERETLQQMLYQQKHENHNLMKELQALRDELYHLELDLVDAERWRGEMAVVSTTPVLIPQTSTAFSSLQNDETSSTRILAQYVLPIECQGGGDKLTPIRPIRKHSTSSAADGNTPSRRVPVSSGSALDLDSLPEIRLWHPSKQEKLLSERLEMYRKRIEEMQAYEVDRQKSFDEIERARAELFTEMNLKLEENRREIQLLRKGLAGIPNEFSEKGAKRSEEQHAVDASTSPMVNNLLDEDVGTRYFEPLSSAKTEAQQTVGEEGIGAHAKGNLEERIKHMSDDVNREEKLLQELLDAASTSPDSLSVSQPLLFCNENESDERRESVTSHVSERCQTSHLSNSSSVKDRRGSLWELIALAEENERIVIAREEKEETIRILLWSRMYMVAIVENATTRALVSAKEVEVIANTLSEMEQKVSSLNEQRHELESEVERLQEAILSLKRKEIANDNETKETKVAAQKLESISTPEEAWVQDRLEPLQYVCQAYTEVVGAQIALLRTLSVDHDREHATVTNDDCERIIDALDTIPLGPTDFFQLGNNSEAMKNATTSSEPPDMEKLVVTSSKEGLVSFDIGSSLFSSVPLPKYPNCVFSSEVCENDLKGAVNTSSGIPIKDSASAQMTTPQVQDDNTLDKNHDRPSTVLKKENDKGSAPTQRVGVVGSSSWSTPTSSFFLGEHMAIPNSNTAPTTNSTPHLASESGKEFLLDPLLYFMTNRDTAVKAEPHPVVENRAPVEDKDYDFFTSASPFTQSTTKRGREPQGFVAEFDPFA